VAPLISNQRTLIEGLAFGEGPRWRDGRLYYSDMHRHVVETVDLDGEREAVCVVEGRPSGLGWLPDGRMLVVSMTDRRILRLEPDGDLVEHADLSGLASNQCNDMVVGPDGTAYVGNFGFDLHAGDPFRPAELVSVAVDGTARVEDDTMEFPNGSVITPDGATLIVAQSHGRDLVAFDIGPDGRLGGRRTWADLDGGVPDGIALDAEGAVWYADPRHSRCVRVAEGGEVLETVEVDRGCYACALGGPERRHLFVLTAATSRPDEAAEQLSGRIEVVEVGTPGAGWP
jgi:sugar lactone lactonase YvrE